MSKKAYIIAIATIKGGIGKSSVSQNLGGALSKMGKKVLVIDMDPQGNTTDTVLGRRYSIEGGPSMVEVLKGKTPIEKIIQKGEEYDIAPASEEMYLLQTNKAKNLKKAVHDLDYDVVIVDTPPTISSMTVSALQLSDYVVILSEQNTYSVKAIEKLVELMEDVRTVNKELIFGGVLLNFYAKSRANEKHKLKDEITEEIIKRTEAMGSHVYETRIRSSDDIPKSQEPPDEDRLLPGLPSVFSYNSRGATAKLFKKLAEEILQDIENINTNRK